MGRPRLIILIRHGQSEGNKNRDIHQSIPDHRVKLTPDGWTQALDAGRRLRALLRPEDKLHFFTSPYRRTRETTEGILSTLTSDDPEPSPFQRSKIKVYEEPRLREQDFGNFQPCSAEMERMWQERADYGHFFYRIPNGESAADAYDRVAGFNESLWRSFSEDDFADVCVLVTHGLMSRVFLMKWYHFSVEYFEDLRNINHCEFLVMRKNEGTGKYTLETKLRTWSELRRERAALVAKEKEEGEEKLEETKEVAKLERQKTYPVPERQWGGCPDGCTHNQHFRIRRDMAELVQVDEVKAAQSVAGATPNGTGTNGDRKASKKQTLRADGGSGEARGSVPPEIDVTIAREELVSSPDGTPSFITIEDRLRNHLNHLKSPYEPHPPFLHIGRDGGGSFSGNTSAAGSDDEVSEGESKRRLAAKLARARGEKVGSSGAQESSKSANGENGQYRRAYAEKLGDAPSDHGDHADHEDHGDEDLDKAEKEDKSLEGSVY